MAELVCYIPSYNDSEWVKESLDSLADWRVVISDNASAEPHREALRALAGAQVQVIRQEKSLGRVGNWRFCVDHFIGSGAQWMKFLCAGDVHKPNSRDIFLRAIERHPAARHIVPRIDNVWPHGRETWRMTSKEGMVSTESLMAAIAEFGNVFHGLIAPLFHIDAVKNGFTFGEETMDFCADLMFSMNLARHAPTVYLTEATAEFIGARRKSMQAGLYTLKHLLEEGLLRLRAAETFFELTGDHDRRTRLLSGIADWMRDVLKQPLERLTGDAAYHFELIPVDAPAEPRHAARR